MFGIACGIFRISTILHISFFFIFRWVSYHYVIWNFVKFPLICCNFSSHHFGRKPNHKWLNLTILHLSETSILAQYSTYVFRLCKPYDPFKISDYFVYFLSANNCDKITLIISFTYYYCWTKDLNSMYTYQWDKHVSLLSSWDLKYHDLFLFIFRCFEGYNATIFAYGQVSNSKTLNQKKLIRF